MNSEEMITEIMLWTNYSEEYLRRLDLKELERLFRDKVPNHG